MIEMVSWRRKLEDQMDKRDKKAEEDRADFDRRIKRLERQLSIYQPYIDEHSKDGERSA